MRNRLATPVAAALSMSGAMASADTLTVCATGCQYDSILQAIEAAQDGDVIQLSAEIYEEGESIDPAGKQITLRGALDKAGNPSSVIDGGNPVGGTSGVRVLVCRTGETSTTVFENLVIQNGYAVGNFTIGNGGGGMYNDATSPTVINCVFRNNLAVYNGGGMFNDNGSRPTVEDCVFTGNSAYVGGGMCNTRFVPGDDDSDGEDELSDEGPILIDSIFEGNFAQVGGAMATYTNASLAGCSLTDNTANSGAGGIYTGFGSEAVSNPSLIDTTVCGNQWGQISAGYQDLGGNCVTNSCDDCDPSSADSCPADLDGNDLVDSADLGLVIGGWGTSGSVADIDGDGVVNATDLGLVIGAWGPCP